MTCKGVLLDAAECFCVINRCIWIEVIWELLLDAGLGLVCAKVPGKVSRALQGCAVIAPSLLLASYSSLILSSKTNALLKTTPMRCLWAEIPVGKYLENVLAEEKINLSLGYCGGGGDGGGSGSSDGMAFEMVTLESCGSDAQRCLQPELGWVIEQLRMSQDSFDYHTHR